MAFTPKFIDLVRNVATVSGTGPVTLGGAVNGYASLAAAVSAGDQFYYCIQGIDKPTEREIGRGTMQADGKVAREAVAGPLTNFTGGTKTIALVAAAEWFTQIGQQGAEAAGGVANRVDLAAKPAGALSPLHLKEGGREGLFLFDNGNLSAKVAADTAQGIYVAPASDPTGTGGAWVRKFSGAVDPRWFGLSISNSGAQNDAAIQAMFATLRARSAVVGIFSQSSEPIAFPQGQYAFASTIELTDGTWIVEGAGQNDDAGTILKFPAGVTGIRVQRYNTSGAAGTRAAAKGADRSIIRNLIIDGAFSATEGEAHGIHLRARAFIENVTITDFEGDGIYIAAVAGGSPEGNANLFRIDSCRVIRCRDGFSVGAGGATADVNGGLFLNCDASSNRRWGFSEKSFLGNIHIGGHADSNGITSAAAAIAPTVVSHGGNRYGVIAGQETGASTNAPTGTTADNAWWYYISAGGVIAGMIPAWSSGATYRAGGSYHSNNSNAANLFEGCYHESGQGKAQVASPSLVVGGTLAFSIFGTAPEIRSGSTGHLVSSRGVGQTKVMSGGSTLLAAVGEASSSLGTILYASDTVAAPAAWRLKFSGNELITDYGNGGTARVQCFTGPNTTFAFGTGAAIPYAAYFPRLFVGPFGDDINNARRIQMESAAPAANAHAQGEFAFNRAAATNAPFGWRCTAAGTPGTWEALYSGVSASHAIGYTTGAGGAVTQATSKSTGVTLNKTSGQVTMNGAALAAGATVSFLLTNSMIAATDVVIVNIASGAAADSYEVSVTAVAAGSCRIQLRNISAGPLSEVLVLNFALLKAAAA